MNLKKKKILFSIFLIPVLLLTGETVLRVSDFNYVPVDLGFKLTQEYKIFEKCGKDYSTKKEKSEIFFPQSFPVKKNPKEIRIFVLGGSSVWCLGDMKQLRERLRESSKGRIVRIVNIGGNSYGTTRLLLCLQEILEYNPDIILLYSGHNEYEEEFIKQTLFKENEFRSLDDNLRKYSRLYQLFSKAVHQASDPLLSHIIRSRNEGMLPFFPPKVKIAWSMDFDKEYIMQRYESNVNKIVNIAKNRRIKIAISTVAYSRMVPPHKPANGDFDKGISSYKKGNYSEAKALFETAIDADLQPHRACNTTNAIIKKISRSNNVPLIEVDRAIVEASEHGIPGQELFEDYCHLNEIGNQILLDMFYRAIIENKMMD